MGENFEYDGYFSWDHVWIDYYPWSFTLKDQIVEPGRKFEEFTICHRVYSLVYNQKWAFATIRTEEGNPEIVFTHGYKEKMDKHMQFLFVGPKETPFEAAFWSFSSIKNMAEAQNEWSFFRLVKEKYLALRWHHVCIMFNKKAKNSGLVSNGEIVANRNQSDLWANEDNFYTSFSFEPAKKVSTDGFVKMR